VYTYKERRANRALIKTPTPVPTAFRLPHTCRPHDDNARSQLTSPFWRALPLCAVWQAGRALAGSGEQSEANRVGSLLEDDEQVRGPYSNPGPNATTHLNLPSSLAQG
jgi:hypothetical protein